MAEKQGSTPTPARRLTRLRSERVQEGGEPAGSLPQEPSELSRRPPRPGGDGEEPRPSQPRRRKGARP
ncbi:MAG: hypothetical protein U0002_05820 [Thermoanaerobaculia bacterium]